MRLILTGLFLTLSNLLFSQPCWTWEYLYAVNFDDGQCMEGLYIDTVTNANNIWQIGAAQKGLFLNADSFPNVIVIVTDTINPYPINDTSSFIFSHISGAGFFYNHTASIEGFYMVNSDSLNDYGIIELSPDNGITWFDMINDISISSAWDTDIPILTGNSNAWKYFKFNTLSIAGVVGIDPGDTLKYRFTFISDSNLDTQDGLMFDSFFFQDWVEGIDELGLNQIDSKLSPNPTNGMVTIEFDNPDFSNFELKILNGLGKEIKTISDLAMDSATIDLSNLDSGIYMYTLRSIENRNWTYGKFVKD